MLSKLATKLCPLMSLALTFSCGKKINDPEPITSGLSRTTQRQDELAPVLTLQLDSNEASQTSFQLLKSAYFLLPQKLIVTSFNGAGKKVRIKYNVQADGNYEFYCVYESSLNQTELDFKACYSSSNALYIDSVDQLQNALYMDQDTQIQMELLNSSSPDLLIQAVYTVNW
jgi:hypothetical protein